MPDAGEGIRFLVQEALAPDPPCNEIAINDPALCYSQVALAFVSQYWFPQALTSGMSSGIVCVCDSVPVYLHVHSFLNTTLSHCLRRHMSCMLKSCPVDGLNQVHPCTA